MIHHNTSALSNYSYQVAELVHRGLMAVRGRGERTFSAAVAAIFSASLESRVPSPRLPPIFTAATAAAAAAITAPTLPLTVLLFSVAFFAAALAVSIGAGPTPAALLLGHHHETILSVKTTRCLGKAGVLLL